MVMQYTTSELLNYLRCIVHLGIQYGLLQHDYNYCTCAELHLIGNQRHYHFKILLTITID